MTHLGAAEVREESSHERVVAAGQLQSLRRQQRLRRLRSRRELVVGAHGGSQHALAREKLLADDALREKNRVDEESGDGRDVLLAQRRRGHAVQRGVGAEEQLRGLDGEGEERVRLAAEIVVDVETGGGGGGEGEREQEGAGVWQVGERRGKGKLNRKDVSGELTGGAGEKRGNKGTLAGK